VPFATEAERRVEALERELEQERAGRRAAEAARDRLQTELDAVRRDFERARGEIERLQPNWNPPLGWLRMPVVVASALILLAVAIGVGAVVRTVRSEARAEVLAHERDVLRQAIRRDAVARRAERARVTQQNDVGCLSACGCPDGQGCVGEVCREGVTPAHCCDRPECPSGAACQHWDGSEAVCP
jgi:hypothetical protein